MASHTLGLTVRKLDVLGRVFKMKHPRPLFNPARHCRLYKDHFPLALILGGSLVLLSCGNLPALAQMGERAFTLVGADPAGLDTAALERLTGHKGTLNEREGVFRVNVPRSDLQVTTAGVRMTPPLGLTSWAAFQRAGRETMVMGDMVMTEDQVNPVMSVALDNGLEVTGLHNHFFWDKPKVMFMHIGGKGDQTRLASAVGKVFAKIDETRGGKGEIPTADLDPSRTSLDPTTIEAILGYKGDLANGVYKVTIGRTTTMHGVTVGNTMGVNTWAAFVGSNDRAMVDGDFAMLEDELQGVLKALRHAGINVVAIHNHMTMESPRVMFLHYWGVGPTRQLATGLKAALDATKSGR